MVRYHYGTVIFTTLLDYNVIVDDTNLKASVIDGTSHFQQGRTLGYGEREVIHHKCDGELFGSPVSGDTPFAKWLTSLTVDVIDEPHSDAFEFFKTVKILGTGYPPFEIWPTFAPDRGNWMYDWYITGSVYYRPGRDKGVVFNFPLLAVGRVSLDITMPSLPLRRKGQGQTVSLGNRSSTMNTTVFPDGWTANEWLNLLIEDHRVSYSAVAFSGGYITLRSAKLQKRPIKLPLEYLLFCRDALMTDMTFISEKNYVLSDISQSIANQSEDLDINSIAYAKEALEYIGSILHIASSGVDLSLLYKALSGDTLSIAKLAANGVLSGSYGLNLTIRDTQELVEFLTRKNDYPTRISRSSGTVRTAGHGIQLSAEYHIKCRYATTDHGIRGILNKLYATDTFPTATNMWDLVPYSFVVDWVFPFDRALSGLDTEARLSVLPIKQILRSEKITVSFSPDWCTKVLGCTGSLTFSTYERRQSGALPPIYPRYDGNTQFDSWVQAGALIIQRLR